MAYLGIQPNTPLLNTSTETFSGDGILFQFTLARSVASASDLDVMIGSTLQRPNTDYTANGTELLFASPPTAGTNNITVTYRAGALSSLDLTVEAVNAGTAAAPGLVSLAANNTGLYWANASSMTVSVSGADRAVFNANAVSVSNITGAVVVAGGIGINGNINANGTISITDTTQSSNTGTGSITTAGGVGVTGNLNVGGDITCVGDFTVNGTFTTTGADSLTVTDPFIFLANANPGDSFDTGVISQYFDGADTRYTGYFRDITDAKYKLFTNLLPKPTTEVDINAPSFQLTDLLLANISATGNVSGTYLLGNGAFLTGVAASGSSNTISNYDSKVTIPTANGNIVNNVNGVTVAVVSSSGVLVTGTLSASTTISAAGNVIAGNIQTAGLFSSTGNVTSAGNVSGGNIITGGLITTVANVVGNNVTAVSVVSAGGNIIGGNIRTVGIVSAVSDVFGNNISAANNLTAAADANITANVRAGNVFSTGVVTATGNITASYFLGNGSQLSGIVNAGLANGTSNIQILNSSNITVNVNGTSNVAAFANTGAYVTGLVSVSGNVTGGNITTAGLVQTATLSATGEVALVATTANINIGTSQTTGIITIGGISQTGALYLGISTANHTVLIGGGITGTGNIKNVNIGENGGIGSTTNINIGPTTNGTAAGLATFAAATRVVIANTSNTALSVAGNISVGNLNASGLSLTGNVQSPISTASNITGGNLNATGISLSGNVLSALISASNITGANIIATSAVNAVSISASGNITGGNVFGGANVNATTHTGTTVSVTGNITGGNVLGGANVNATTHTGTTVSVIGNVIGGNLISAVLNSAANATITSTAANASIILTPTGTGTVIVNKDITNGQANGVGNIGSTTGYFNTVFAKATSAQYADLAEWYEADAHYPPGTVLVFGGDKEVTQAIGINDVRVAGVVSTNPAHIMNSGLKAQHVAAVALTGRVPTLVVGPVAKGDMMVTAGGGRAQACTEPRMGAVIGKALQDHPGGTGIIEIVVGRL
jgi:hypothetical protein